MAHKFKIDEQEDSPSLNQSKPEKKVAKYEEKRKKFYQKLQRRSFSKRIITSSHVRKLNEEEVVNIKTTPKNKKKIYKRALKSAQLQTNEKIKQGMRADENTAIDAMLDTYENTKTFKSTSKRIKKLRTSFKETRLDYKVNQAKYQLEKQKTQNRLKKQKNLNKKRYAKAAYKASQKNISAFKQMYSTQKGVVNLVAKLLTNKVVVVLICFYLIFMTLIQAIGAFAIISLGNASFSASIVWLSEEEDVEKAELEYTRMEAELGQKMQNIQSLYPGYDNYYFDLGTIKHNPITLINYLSAKYGDFTYDEITTELDTLFARQYTFSTNETTTSWVEKGKDGKENIKTERNLNVKLSVTQLESLAIQDFSSNSEMQELYQQYQEINGGWQQFETPIDLNWYIYSNYYGFKYSGKIIKDCGLTISCPEKSKIKSMCKGLVVNVDNAGKYGNYVQIRTKDYFINYAQLNDITVKFGDTVEPGQIIGHSSFNLYIEIIDSKNQNYINPIFYIMNGEGDYPGFNPNNTGIDISVIPGNTQDKIWKSLKAMGLTDAGAAAVLGNIDIESSFNPAASNKGNYIGLCQWGMGRKDNLLAYAERNQKDWTDLQLQINFFNIECEHDYGDVFTLLKTTNDVTYATDYFCVFYEGCVGNSDGNDAVSSINGKVYQCLADRIASAKAYYSAYSGKQKGA